VLKRATVAVNAGTRAASGSRASPLSELLPNLHFSICILQFAMIHSTSRRLRLAGFFAAFVDGHLFVQAEKNADC